MQGVAYTFHPKGGGGLTIFLLLSSRRFASAETTLQDIYTKYRLSKWWAEQWSDALASAVTFRGFRGRAVAAGGDEGEKQQPEAEIDESEYYFCRC
jgi:hypothetical protein